MKSPPRLSRALCWRASRSNIGTRPASCGAWQSLPPSGWRAGRPGLAAGRECRCIRCDRLLCRRCRARRCSHGGDRAPAAPGVVRPARRPDDRSPRSGVARRPPAQRRGPTEFGASFNVDLRAAQAGGASTALRGGVRASVSGQFTGSALETLRGGRVVRFPASLRRPARFLNPGVADHELGFSRRDIVLLASIKGAALVDVVERGGAWQERPAPFARMCVAQCDDRWAAGPRDRRPS